MVIRLAFCAAASTATFSFVCLSANICVWHAVCYVVLVLQFFNFYPRHFQMHPIFVALGMSREMKFRWLCLMNSTPGAKIKNLGLWSWRILSHGALKAGGHCSMVPGCRLRYGCHTFESIQWFEASRCDESETKWRNWPLALVETILVWIVIDLIYYIACFQCSPGGKISILDWTGLVSIAFVTASSLWNKLTKIVNSHFAYCTPSRYLNSASVSL